MVSPHSIRLKIKTVLARILSLSLLFSTPKTIWIETRDALQFWPNGYGLNINFFSSYGKDSWNCNFWVLQKLLLKFAGNRCELREERRTPACHNSVSSEFVASLRRAIPIEDEHKTVRIRPWQPTVNKLGLGENKNRFPELSAPKLYSIAVRIR